MTWALNPHSLRPERTDDGPTQLSGAEAAQQTWPPCPVCGTEIEVDLINVGDLGNRDKYILGHWRCPRGCDPRDQADAPPDQPR